MVAWFDRHIVDAAMNGIGWLCGRAGAELRKTSNGQAQSYAGVFVGATVVIALLLILYGNQIGNRTTAHQNNRSRIMVTETQHRGDTRQ